MTTGTAARLDVPDAVGIAVDAIREARIVLVCSLYGSTGSFFVYSLLDAHPALYTFPFDIRRIPILIEDFEAHSRGDHLRGVLEGNARLFDTASEPAYTNSLRYLGDRRDAGLVIDRARFTAYLTAILGAVEFTPRTFTLALVLAYNFARDVQPTTPTFALYVHDLLRAVRLWQPRLGAVEIVAACRHPVNVYASYCRRKRFDAGDRGTLPAPYAMTHIEGFTELPRLMNEAAAAETPCALVMIEELHAQPRRSVQALAEHLKIACIDTLLHSTIGGLKWWGSHQRVGTINGFDPSLHATVAVDELGARAERLVWQATGHFQRHTGYAAVRPAAADRGAGWRPRVPIRFYRDLALTALSLIRTARSGRERAGILLRAARLAVSYGRIAARERAAAQSMARHDARVDYGRVTVINPLSRGSVRWPRREDAR